MLLRINKNNQNGAVSIFIVIFVTLLVSVVTVSFVRVMINEQQQATNSDLSRSAYDSAQAGVEDAKRALMQYKVVCTANPSSAECDKLKKAFYPLSGSQKCNEVVKTLTDINTTEDEIKVDSGGSSNKYNQAYTCTLIDLNTNDYLGQLSSDQSIIIPLSSVGNTSQVTIEWFSAKDLTTVDAFKTNLITKADALLGKPLLQRADWKSNRPPIMRTQLIQFKSGFKLTDLNEETGGNVNVNRTLFLYPSGNSGSKASDSNALKFVDDARRTATKSPNVVSCKGDISDGGYACTVTIDLPNQVGGGSGNTGYLRLTSLYNKSNYRVTLPGTTFDGVQPEIDSTGRADTLFRRVKSRVELVDTNFPFPEAAVDITGNLCKTFVITDNPDDYDGNGCNSSAP